MDVTPTFATQMQAFKDLEFTVGQTKKKKNNLSWAAHRHRYSDTNGIAQCCHSQMLHWTNDLGMSIRPLAPPPTCRTPMSKCLNLGCENVVGNGMCHARPCTLYTQDLLSICSMITYKKPHLERGRPCSSSRPVYVGSCFVRAAASSSLASVPRKPSKTAFISNQLRQAALQEPFGSFGVES